MSELAASVWEYGAVASPFGREAEIMEGPEIIVIARILVAKPPAASVTLKVIEVGPPAVVGVPLIVPVEALEPVLPVMCPK